MAKIVFSIIAIIILLVGVVLVFGGPVFYPEKKYTNNVAIMNRKRTKLRLIGYVVCLVAFLVVLIIGSI